MTNRTIIDGVTYATNDNGNGLFFWAKSYSNMGHCWYQIQGNCQFSVNGIKYPQEKIRRWVRKNVLE